VEEQSKYRNCASLYSLCERGRRGKDNLNITFFHELQEFKHNYMFGRTGFKHLNVLNDNKYILIKLQATSNTKLHSLEWCHKLHAFTVLHTSNDIEKELYCVVLRNRSPDGIISLITIEAYNIRWVHNIHCLFTAI